MKNKLYTIFFVSTLCICNIHLGFCQKKTTLYYLCIGSEHYSIDSELYEEGFNGLLNLEAATTSSNKMATLFKDFGATYGKVINSSPEHFITKKYIFDAIEDVIRKIKKEKKTNPFLIIYYAGHGFSCPDFEGHFIPPGDFIKNPSSLDLDGWIKYGIGALDIHEKISNAKLNHMILLDCCHEGKQKQDNLPDQSVVKSLGIDNVESLMKNTYTIFRAMNRMVGPNPVIFSTSVDSSVPTVPLPDQDNEEVGPLCRKAYIIKKKVGDATLSIENFTMLLLDKNLDALTVPAVSFVQFDYTKKYLIKMK